MVARINRSHSLVLGSFQWAFTPSEWDICKVILYSSRVSPLSGFLSFPINIDMHKFKSFVIHLFMCG